MKLILLFILVIIFDLLFMFLNKKYNYENYENSYEKYCIVVLTRGYNNLNEYKKLIDRNIAIYDKIYSKKNNFDIIIFNEGNINTEQQKYIQSNTPNMPLIFKTVQFYNTDIINDYCPPILDFSSGYKNMCYFWSIDYLEYLKEYDFMIRIDEDCVIETLDPNIIDKYKEKNIKFSSAYFQGEDDPNVTIGMKELVDNFMTKHNLKKIKDELRCPYTNFMIVNIPYFKNNKTIQQLLDEIKKSNCIFSNRWGDLPIFGYILTYLVNPELYIEDKSIKYYHDSHKIKINF